MASPSPQLRSVPVRADAAAARGLADDALARRPYRVTRLRPVPDPAPRLLRVHVLGELRVEGPDGPLEGSWLDQRAGELLRYLTCVRHRIAPAEEIAEAIWPHAGHGASNTVRHFVHVLRERLDPDRERGEAHPFVVSRRGGYGLDPHAVWIDADAFERGVDDGLAALAAGDLAGAAASLDGSVALYRDDLLADLPYAEWALHERERLRGLACDALRALAELRAGDAAATVAHLDRLAELEPFDDDVQRGLIGAWLALGRTSRAVRHYESYRVRLARELGQRPAFELRDLAAP